jgi:transcriptional regulator with XRE-family HTH domain
VMHRMYVEEELTQSEISDELGCSIGCVSEWLGKHGIGTGCVETSDDNPWYDESRLKELLHDKGLSQKEVGDKLGCSLDTVRYSRKRLGISKYPPISHAQSELLTGALMGDASVSETEGNPKFVLHNTNRKYLNWFYDQTSNILNEPHLVRTAKEQAERMNGSVENYNDYYAICGSHPDFNVFREWYSSGQKRFPSDLELTRHILKMWYVCDGTLSSADNGRPHVEIAVSNEMDREDYLISLFDNLEFTPSLSYWTLYFGVDDSEKFLDWLSDPIPGFEYKWGEANCA